MKESHLVRRYSLANPTIEQLHELTQELASDAVSNDTRQLFRKLSSYPPVLRLSINIRNLLVEQSIRIVRNWVEALAPEERAALSELEQLSFSSDMMSIAHGLLNVHERWVVMKSTAKSFREARPRKDDCLDEKPLDDILR